MWNYSQEAQKEELERVRKPMREWNTIKRNYVCIMWASEAKEEKGTENLFKEIMFEKSFKFGKKNKIHEAQKSPK